MEITNTSYKNIPAIEWNTKKYSVLLLPAEGGKMASFRDRTSGKEYLLQNPSKMYLHLDAAEDFEHSECSGFDDMFPTIDPVVVNGVDYPDHGEICRLPFAYTVSEDGLKLFCDSKLLGVHYEKTFSEGENGSVRIQYAITNPTDTDLDVLWAAHCIVCTEPGGQVLIPFAQDTPVDILYDSAEEIPPATRMACLEDLLTTPPVTDEPRAFKLYFSDLCTNGFMGYRYPAGDTFMMTFDCDQLPCLGLWINRGYLNNAHCVGLEPCTVGYDTVLKGKQYGQTRILKSGETLRFAITLSVV